jgi:Tc5 transposase DNA-binding domain/helix-turn-helix, Psq domain
MKSYAEEDLESAVEAVKMGRSIRKAALEWGVPRATLHDRIHGTQSRPIAFSRMQRLSQVQEDHLSQWILTQAALGLPPSHAQVKAFVNRILEVKGDHHSIGKNWIKGFLQRYPVVKAQWSKSIDSKRVNGATTDIIRAWFRYMTIPAVKAVKPENRWNMDESGLLQGQGSNGLVLGSSQKMAIRKKQPGSRAWTSFVECILATG